MKERYRIIRRTLTLTITMILTVVMVFVPVEQAAAGSAGWVYKGSKKVAYRTQSGKLLRGVHNIGGKAYYFRKNGDRAWAKRERLLKIGGEWYSVKKDGSTRCGWQTYGKNLYYFGKPNGAMVRNKVRGGIRLQANGQAYMSLDAALKYKCIRDIKKVSSLDAKKADQLKAVWNFMSSRKFRYATTTYPKAGDKRWPKTVANKFITERKGNCYGFACAFAAYADTIGYDPYVVAGRCPGGRDGARDGYTRHSVVKIAGKWYDPEANIVGWARGIYNKSRLSFSFKQRKYTRYRSIDGNVDAKIAGSKTSRDSYAFKGEGYYGFDSEGGPLKGVHLISGKLFNFTHEGPYGYYTTKTEYGELKKHIKKGSDFSELSAIIGKPSSYENGCDISEKGYDRTYKYPYILVICRVSADGNDITVDSVQKR